MANYSKNIEHGNKILEITENFIQKGEYTREVLFNLAVLCSTINKKE